MTDIHKHFLVRVRNEDEEWAYMPTECRTERSAFVTLAAVMCAGKNKYGEVLSYATTRNRTVKVLCKMERMT